MSVLFFLSDVDTVPYPCKPGRRICTDSVFQFLKVAANVKKGTKNFPKVYKIQVKGKAIPLQA